jgi:superfamily II DNA or RNA helicase
VINLNLINNRQGEIITDVNTLNLIRNKFSIANPAHGRGNRNRFTPARLYSITPSGRFDVGLLDNIKAYLDSEQLFYNIDNTLEKIVNVGFENPTIKQYSLIYRDHQDSSIKAALKKGRGVVVIPTAGGKTLIMSGIIESIRLSIDKPNAKALVIVPSLQLVTQTAKDFEQYGMNSVTKWSGNNVPDPDATTIVAGTQILLSDKTDLTILDDIDIILVDEVHGLRRGNEINKIFQLVNCRYKFGFTGTMPPSLIDQWNIIGKIGPIVYEEKTQDLREKNYVSNFKIIILDVKHDNIPNFNKNVIRPAEAYNNEIEYLMHNTRRNEIISKLASRLNNNTIIMVDRIDHGVNIELALKQVCKNDRPIYFIQGSTEIEEREKIRSLMEERSDVIAVAVSKIFSTGINIPNLHNIIFASAGKAKIKIMQSIGRALRLHPTKSIATIFDIADNTKYGKTHIKERIKLYENEKYNYETKKI